MNEQIKTTYKQAQSIGCYNQRGIGVIELLFAVTTLGAAVLVAAMSGAKRPLSGGD